MALFPSNILCLNDLNCRCGAAGNGGLPSPGESEVFFSLELHAGKPIGPGKSPTGLISLTGSDAGTIFPFPRAERLG